LTFTTVSERVLCLPSGDVATLADGRSIVIIAKAQIPEELTFFLCPLPRSSEVEYRHIDPPIDLIPDKALTIWAKCRRSIIIHEEKELSHLLPLTILTEDSLKNLLAKQGHLFVSFLRIYHLPNQIEISTVPPLDKAGKFIGLSQLCSSEIKDKFALEKIPLLPIVSDATFAKRLDLSDCLSWSSYLKLERLESQTAKLALSEPKAKALDTDLRHFLGWQDSADRLPIDDWISQIASVGNSSDGNEFEKLTRKALIKLGFSNSLNNPKASLDPEATGGAGGIDFYANYPYSIVGECKASKSVKINDNKDGAPIQLLKLGQNHLKLEEYDRSVKVILAAGDVTSYADSTSKSHKMNILRPETLQKLVELKAIHPGSINLWTLQECLANGEFGVDADRKVNDYIEREWQQIELRSNPIETVRESQNIYKSDKVDISQILGSCRHSSYENIKSIEEKEILNLAMELASPLTGYLGRIVESGVDRFYFIRELPVREAKA
jgi:hypothetical protein